MMGKISEEEAIRIHNTKEYEKWDDREKVAVMLYGRRLCMPFDIFHAAIERVLDRPVFTHELGLNYEGIVAEFEGKTEKPTLEEIINLIPANKRAVVLVYSENGAD